MLFYLCCLAGFNKVKLRMVKILVIDDSPFIYSAIKRVLEPKGFEIIGNALNGREGLELYDKCLPDIITLDITMPVMDGFETAKHLFIKNSDVKIIMLSAISDKQMIEQVKELGIKEFLAKPFKPDELLASVNRVLED